MDKIGTEEHADGRTAHAEEPLSRMLARNRKSV
jgi:hypothetical protein